MYKNKLTKMDLNNFVNELLVTLNIRSISGNQNWFGHFATLLNWTRGKFVKKLGML